VSPSITILSLTPIWVPVVAALGFSVLTGLVTFWLSWLQRRHEQRIAAQRAKVAAYGEFLARSFRIVTRIVAIGTLMGLNSGFQNGLDVTFGLRKPVGLLELRDWLNQGFGPLVDTWSWVWVVGTQEAIDIADRLVRSCSDLIDAAGTPDPNRGWLLRTFQGERWTPTQCQTFNLLSIDFPPNG
jgi:hypothetical protein